MGAPRRSSAIYKSIGSSASAIWDRVCASDLAVNIRLGDGGNGATLLRGRLEHALVARSRDLHRVRRAVWLHGQFDVVGRAVFFEVCDELVGGVVFAVGP